MKISALTSRFPYPLEKGDKLRIYKQLESLSQEHEIHLHALSHHVVSAEHIGKLKAFCKEVHIYNLNFLDVIMGCLWALFKGKPFSVGYFYSPRISKIVRTNVKADRPDAIYCQLIRMAPYTKGLEMFKVLDYMDAFSLGMRRNASGSNFLLKLFLKMEAAALERYEQEVSEDFDKLIIISEQDKSAISENIKPHITVISNGIDEQYFSPKVAHPSFDIVFVGNLGYYPNVTASLFLIDEVLPLMEDDTTVLLAGARPHGSIIKRSNQRIQVKGWMEDIRDAYLDGKVFVATIFAGSGQQNKILEAMSLGLPCVTTSQVNNSIGAVDGKEIFIADTPTDIADCITLLLKDHELRVNTGKSARAFIETHYPWIRINKLLLEQFQ